LEKKKKAPGINVAVNSMDLSVRGITVFKKPHWLLLIALKIFTSRFSE
jgi:hypothetical protein